MRRVASSPGKARFIKAVGKHSICSGNSTVTRDSPGTNFPSIYETSLCSAREMVGWPPCSLWHTVLKMVAVKAAVLVGE